MPIALRPRGLLIPLGQRHRRLLAFVLLRRSSGDLERLGLVTVVGLGADGA
jgi:hypothetical protein